MCLLLININQINIKRFATYFTSNKYAQHTLFWLFTVIFTCFIEYSIVHAEIWSILTKQIINVFFYAILVYFNIYFLVPNYFQDKRYPTYFILLIFSVIIITPIYLLTLYFKFYNDPIARLNLLNLQYYYYLFNFFIIGSSTVFVIIKDWILQKREKKELEKRNIQTELNFLKTQINPHFLFNTLNSLYALTLKKSDNAPEIVIKLSEMMRYMLYECNEKKVPLTNELNYLQNYIALEKLRQTQNVDIQFIVEGKVEDQMIAPLIFISFLENSFKHGLTNKLNTGFVHVYFKIDTEIIHCTIENSKPDIIPISSIDKNGGIGLENVKKRLELIYPSHHSLSIKQTNETFKVDLDIRFIE